MSRSARTRPRVSAAAAVPLRETSARTFRAFRKLLLEADFTVEGVCGRVDIPSVYHFRSRREGRSAPHRPADGLDLLIRLFMDGEPVSAPAVRDHLPDGTLDLAAELGLIRRHPADRDGVLPTVLLYPTEGLHVASDLTVDPLESADGVAEGGAEGGAERGRERGVEDFLPVDAVYPAVTENTRGFLESLPTSPCRRFLEQCAGTGIAALLAAPRAEEAWAVDVAERCTRFARFNALLNNLGNVTALTGDLYEPLGELSFDRIVAHPPYVPALERDLVFRDGGPDGEHITRRIFEGLPRHLEPGGRLHCTCVASDRRGAPLEERIREMIGEGAGAFDVVVVVARRYHPTEYYIQLAARGRMPFRDAEAHHRLFSELAVEAMVHAHIVVERHDAPRPAVTARRNRGAGRTADAVDRLLAVERLLAGPGARAALLESRPRLASDVRLTTGSTVEEGRWIPREATLSVEEPFPIAAEVPVDAAAMLAMWDGSRTGRERLAEAIAGGVLAEDTRPEAFAELLASLLRSGLLELKEPPEARERTASR